jgi:hypothetical protein
MPLSDFDIEQLADEIVARLGQAHKVPTISAITSYIAGLGFPADEAEMLARTVISKTANPTLKPNHIVMLIHGIRTNAEWQGVAVKELSPHCRRVVPIRYGFFDVISFWFPVTFLFRWMPVRKVRDELRNLIANNPTAHISVVAHSFGTYILTKVLKKHFDIKLFRIVLCGAIVPSEYDWLRLPNKPRGGLMNDIGLLDRLPIVAEVSTWGYGPTGTYGFGTGEVHDNFHECGHSGFFTAEHLRCYWIPFLFGGTFVPSPANETRKQPAYGWELLRIVRPKYSIPVIVFLVWNFSAPISAFISSSSSSLSGIFKSLVSFFAK